jgi:hypothetical protein
MFVIVAGIIKFLKFDKGDWNWCPINKGTKKQFECQSLLHQI